MCVNARRKYVYVKPNQHQVKRGKHVNNTCEKVTPKRHQKYTTHKCITSVAVGGDVVLATHAISIITTKQN